MERLRASLARIDGRSFKAYEQIAGHYRGGSFRLLVERVQVDPFSPPTCLRVLVGTREANFPIPLRDTPSRRVALADLLGRRLRDALGAASEDAHPRGRFVLSAGRQTILPRTAVIVDPEGNVEARFDLGLPAEQRRIRGAEAAALLCERLPQAVESALLAKAWAPERLEERIRLQDDQQAIRAALDSGGLVAFVANGSILPRAGGDDDGPLGQGAVPFRSPPSLEIEIPLPGGRSVRGMGIRRGVTLLVGGGYHGKSTLLSAIARGVHDHLEGDGRERVITRSDAVLVRTEPGRAVAGVDMRPFLRSLPGGADPAFFQTQSASGSTSQAASILEALEIGTHTLLLDEDASAANFLIRDARMQALVPEPLEPIRPLIDRIRAMYTGRGVSTVLVTGGSGDYLDVADCVIRMEHFEARDATAEARAVVAAIPSRRRAEDGRFGEIAARCPDPVSFQAGKGKREARIDVRGERTLLYGVDAVDLSALDGIEEPAQVRAIGWAIHLIVQRHLRGSTPLRQAVEAALDEVARRGMDALTPYPRGDLALPRAQDIAAAVNRFRRLRVKPAPPGDENA